MDKELSKKIKDNPLFKDLQLYILSQIDSLNSIEGLDKSSILEAGEIVKARAMSITILENILSPFIDVLEKRVPTDEDIKNKEAKFGL